MAPWVLWLIAAGVLAAGEAVSLDLVLLMAAGGAVGGTAAALIGVPVIGQVAVFAIVTVALLAVVRPVARRHLTEGTGLTGTGVDAVVGRTALVTRPVDRHGGRIRLGADEWTARTQHGGEVFAVGDTVRVLQIEGATAVVGESFE